MTMTTLSDPTLGLLVRVAADEYTLNELTSMLLHADLAQERYAAGSDNSRHGMVRGRLLCARSLALQCDREAHGSLLTFVRILVQQKVPDPYYPPHWFAELCESLLADGYQLTWENWDENASVTGSSDYPTYRILPTDSGPVPLATEISALERDLDLRGYTDAVIPYRQAVNNFGQHQYEAANMALRTTLEALVMELAKDHANFDMQGNKGQGSAAISRLIETGALQKRDGGHMLQGLWQMIHTNGPHPGQSTADETRMRMQLITATARFLLNHFPA